MNKLKLSKEIKEVLKVISKNGKVKCYISATGPDKNRFSLNFRNGIITEITDTKNNLSFNDELVLTPDGEILSITKDPKLSNNVSTARTGGRGCSHLNPTGFI